MMDLLHAGRPAVIAIEGNNFTGRSAFLRDLVVKTSCGEDSTARAHAGMRNAYVGSDVHNYLSGLLPTVRGELVLHGFVNSARREAAEKLLASVSLLPTVRQNPLTLSGGQQVVLALSTALLSTGRLMAVDCSLEQLSPQARSAVLDVLKLPDLNARSILVDNRLREFRERVEVEQVGDCIGEHQPALPKISWAELGPLRDVPSMVLNDVGFRYSPQKPIFEHLSCRFDPGQVYFIEGPNGIGKSTLGKLLCGILRPDHGCLLAGGQPWRPWEKPGDLVAYHFQNPDLQLFATRLAEQFSEDSRELTAAFGLHSFLGDHPHNLPFVLRKRVALAIAIARRRPWLILDEPILGQDDENSQVLAQILDHAVGAGAGIIVLSHSTWFKSLVARRCMLELSSLGLQEADPCGRAS